MFNHLWLYGSMQPIHEPKGVDRHLPRYWSSNGQNHPDLAGLVSYRDFGEGRPSPPDAVSGAAWFVRDVHDYFRQELPAALDGRGQVDRAKIARSGRGDAMYQLRYAPGRLLAWPEGHPDLGANLPDPSFPRPAEERALADGGGQP